MAIRLYRAYSPGTRSKSVSFFNDLSNANSEKSLTVGKKNVRGKK
jgi:ribosomal protein L2